MVTLSKCTGLRRNMSGSHRSMEPMSGLGNVKWYWKTRIGKIHWKMGLIRYTILTALKMIFMLIFLNKTRWKGSHLEFLRSKTQSCTRVSLASKGVWTGWTLTKFGSLTAMLRKQMPIFSKILALTRFWLITSRQKFNRAKFLWALSQKQK